MDQTLVRNHIGTVHITGMLSSSAIGIGVTSRTDVRSEVLPEGLRPDERKPETTGNASRMVRNHVRGNTPALDSFHFILLTAGAVVRCILAIAWAVELAHPTSGAWAVIACKPGLKAERQSAHPIYHWIAERDSTAAKYDLAVNRHTGLNGILTLDESRSSALFAPRRKERPSVTVGRTDRSVPWYSGRFRSSGITRRGREP